MISSALAGLGLGLSLIVAIGAQNLFVLRQGMRREHVLAVAVICTLSDAVLIALGVSGIGLALQAVPWLVEAVRYVGAAFLAFYALLALRRAWRPSGRVLGTGSEGRAERAGGPGRAIAGELGAATESDPAADSGPATGSDPAAGRAAALTATRATPVVAACLALTWLNPHVYLDTVFLLGSVAATHGALRWWFALGAASASVIWFFALAYGARYLGRWLSTARAWRIVDAVIALIMLALAASLVLRA